MRALRVAVVAVVSTGASAAAAQQYGSTPAVTSADAGFAPDPPDQPPTTRPAPPEYRVWRLVSPTEAASWPPTDPNRPRGWLRLDTDATGFNFYAGGSFRMTDGLAFSPFAHLTGAVAEPNLALTWSLGSLWLMPTIGTSMNFATTQAASLDPQLFVVVDVKFVYVELWEQYFAQSVYHPSGIDTYAQRAIVLVTLPRSAIALGGEWDYSRAVHNAPPSPVLSSIWGGRVNLRVGDQDTLGLFLGYQFASQARGSFDGAAGRFEYVHQW